MFCRDSPIQARHRQKQAHVYERFRLDGVVRQPLPSPPQASVQSKLRCRQQYIGIQLSRNKTTRVSRGRTLYMSSIYNRQGLNLVRSGSFLCRVPGRRPAKHEEHSSRRKRPYLFRAEGTFWCMWPPPSPPWSAEGNVDAIRTCLEVHSSALPPGFSGRGRLDGHALVSGGPELKLLELVLSLVTW